MNEHPAEQENAMKRVERKIKNSAGFTLAEMLLAVMILLMASAIVATGIPSARNAYEKFVLASNAELLLSTAMNELRNELGTATGIEVTGNVITYTNSFTGTKSQISKSDDGIMRQRVVGMDSTKALLVSEVAATGGLRVTYDTVTKNNGAVVFTGLSVKRPTGTANLTTPRTFSIRILSS